MSERKYTDEEIINKMSAYIEMSCRMCGFKTLCNEPCAIEYIKAALKAALGLIKSQKAEIEKLQEVNADLNESLRLAAEANKDLQAEIEEWKARANDWQNQYLKLIEEMEIYQEHIDQDIIYAKAIKAEAIKEFAERLKETPIKLGLPLLGLLTKSEIEGFFNHTLLQVRDAIDNLVAEMTEGK